MEKNWGNDLITYKFPDSLGEIMRSKLNKLFK